MVKVVAVSIIGLLGTPLVARGLPRVARLLVVRGEIVAAVRARCKRNRRPSPRRFEGVKPGVASSLVASRWGVEGCAAPTPRRSVSAKSRVASSRVASGWVVEALVASSRIASRLGGCGARVARRPVVRGLRSTRVVAVTRHSPLRCPLNVARWPDSCASGRRPLPSLKLFSPLRSLRLCGEPRPVVRRPLSAQLSSRPPTS